MTCAGTFCLDAVEVSIGSPPLFVVLDAPRGDLLIGHVERVFLGLSDLFLHFWTAAYDVQRRPSEQGRSRVQVAGMHIASNACCFERNASASTEGIAHLRSVTELTHAQFFDQFIQVRRLRSQVRIDDLPRRFRRSFDLLWPCAISQLLIVGHALKNLPFEALLRRPIQSFLPRSLCFRTLSTEKLVSLRGCGQTECVLRSDCLFLAHPTPLSIHCHQPHENVPVLLGVVSGWEQQAQDRRADQNQGFAAPPLAQPRQGLTASRLTLLIALLGQLRDGELGFDEGLHRRSLGSASLMKSGLFSMMFVSMRPCVMGFSVSACRSALRQPMPRSLMALPVAALVIM